MPQISLNLELTDEQYKNLMETSCAAVLEEEATKDAIREIITQQMCDYMKSHIDLVEHCFHTYNGWGWKNAGSLKPSIQEIVMKASENCAKHLEKVVEEYMMDIAKTTKLDDYLMLLMSEAILRGCASGIDDWKREMTIMAHNHTDGLRRLNERLGFGEEY